MVVIERNELEQIREDASAMRERGLAYLDAIAEEFAALLDAAETRDKLSRACELAKSRYETSKAAQAVLENLEMLSS